MSLTTTCIRDYPKPDYIEIGNFAETGAPDDGATRAFSYTQDDADEVPEEFLMRMPFGMPFGTRTLPLAIRIHDVK